MMKLACIALLVAAAQAADTEAPVISLDTFTNNSMVAYNSSSRDLGGTMTKHDSASQTSSCELHFTSDTCQLPTATAFDHNDDGLTVQTVIKAYILGRCGEDPVSCSENGTDCSLTATGWTNTSSSRDKDNVMDSRGEYVFTYDAEDKAGNTAEQVVYALIVRDTNAPFFKLDDGKEAFPKSQTCEKSPRNAYRKPNSNEKTSDFAASTSNSSWVTIEDGIFFKDTSDCAGDIGSDVTVNWGDVQPSTDCCNAQSLSLHASDYAGIFGVNNQNNEFETTAREFTLDYSVVPEVFVNDSDVRGWVTGDFSNPATDMTLECNKDHEFALQNDAWFTARNVNLTNGEKIMFKDASCECGNEELYNTGLPFGDGDCSWRPTATSSNAGMNATHNAIFNVTYTAYDETNGSDEPNTNGGSTVFTVTDTSPPTLNIDLDAVISQYDVGQCVSGNEATCDRKHTLNATTPFDATSIGINQNDSAENLFQLSALTSDVIQHSAGSTKDAAQLEELATHYSCSDDCSEPVKSSKWFHIAVVDGELEAHDCNTLASKFVDADQESTESFEEHVGDNITEAVSDMSAGYRLGTKGTYVLMYQCKDVASHLSQVQCRTIKNEDRTKPIMRIVTSDHVVYRSADLDAPYVDQGAICSDQVDGMMSEKVEVTGDVVNLAVTANYTITYNCADSAGNDAETLYRTVVVYDDICPTCDASADSEITHEASFPYTDADVPCYDDIHDFVQGDEEKYGEVNVEATGSYTITYGWTVGGLNSTSSACTTNDTSSVSVSNDADRYYKCVDSTKAVVDCDASLVDKSKRTVTVEDSMKPVISLHYMAESNSSSRGWVALALASAVAGVALIGFSSRASPVTTVPV